MGLGSVSNLRKREKVRSVDLAMVESEGTRKREGWGDGGGA